MLSQMLLSRPSWVCLFFLVLAALSFTLFAFSTAFVQKTARIPELSCRQQRSFGVVATGGNSTRGNNSLLLQTICELPTTQGLKREAKAVGFFYILLPNGSSIYRRKTEVALGLTPLEPRHHGVALLSDPSHAKDEDADADTEADSSASGDGGGNVDVPLPPLTRHSGAKPLTGVSFDDLVPSGLSVSEQGSVEVLTAVRLVVSFADRFMGFPVVLHKALHNYCNAKGYISDGVLVLTPLSCAARYSIAVPEGSNYSSLDDPFIASDRADGYMREAAGNWVIRFSWILPMLILLAACSCVGACYRWRIDLRKARCRQERSQRASCPSACASSYSLA
mmetsp:Transcript_96833/g.202317  ORF Transcript_96833/g.202317 Transcript_96833/m.202317 type:complete len:336 (-) Transcript_96833:582-1589(-)